MWKEALMKGDCFKVQFGRVKVWCCASWRFLHIQYLPSSCSVFSSIGNLKWSDVWPSMVTHPQNLCSAFNPSKCTHTHTVVNTHTGLSSVVVLRVEESAGHSLPPTYNPCQTWDSNPQPSGYKSVSLTIRPRLPLKLVYLPNYDSELSL